MKNQTGPTPSNCLASYLDLSCLDWNSDPIVEETTRTGYWQHYGFFPEKLRARALLVSIAMLSWVLREAD